MPPLNTPLSHVVTKRKGMWSPWGVHIRACGYGQGDMEFHMASMNSVGWDFKDFFLTTLEDKRNEICNEILESH